AHCRKRSQQGQESQRGEKPIAARSRRIQLRRVSYSGARSPSPTTLALRDSLPVQPPFLALPLLGCHAIPRSNQHSEREQNLPDDSETAGRIRAAVQLSDPAFATPTHSPHPPQLLADDLLQPRRLLELSKQLPQIGRASCRERAQSGRVD